MELPNMAKVYMKLMILKNIYLININVSSIIFCLILKLLNKPKKNINHIIKIYIFSYILYFEF